MPRWVERMDELEQALDKAERDADRETQVRLLRERMNRADSYADLQYHRAQYEHALKCLQAERLFRSDQRLDWVTRQDMPISSRLPIGSARPTITVSGVIASSAPPTSLTTTSGDIIYVSDARFAPTPIRRRYGQGMARGYWRGGIAGKHPGYH